METKNRTKVTIETTVKASPEKVWEYWNEPKHITKWNSASPEWHTPRATNDLRVNGRIVSRMEAKDGSAGFDFGGTYTKVEEPHHLAFTMDDDRKVEVHFQQKGDQIHIKETFEAEEQNPVDFQKQGWQAILDNFKSYIENN